MTTLTTRLVHRPDASEFLLENENATGHKNVMDAGPSAGGKDQGFRPMEMLLAGIAGCSSVDILLILKKGRQTVRDLQVHIEADRAEADPKVFTRIHLHYTVHGDVTEKRLEDAIRLSIDKYCSAAAMLSKTASLETSFSLNPV